MNRNQSNESTKRNHGLGARSPRSVTSTTRANAPSRRALRERRERRNRRNRWNRANARSRGKSTHTKIRGSRLVNHDSHRAGPFFPAPTRARGFDRNQRRFSSIESNDVFGSIGDLTRSNLSIDRSSLFVRFPARFPREVASESTDSIDVRETSRGRRRDEVRRSFVRLIFFVFFVLHPRVRPSVAPSLLDPRVRARTGSI